MHSELTPEQRAERTIDERCSGLWARWYDSGPDDLRRGWWRPTGRCRRLRLLARADVRALQAHIYAEHGRD